MSIYYFHCLIIYFCSFSLIYTINDDNTWPWKKTNYLSRSNWSSLLNPNNNNNNQHPVWFIFYYLNYCGYCKKAEPGWEAVAQYAINWSKYIQIGAYDCASESLSIKDICQDEKYPQWRIYCPLTNTTHLAFSSEQRTIKTKPEEILIWLLNKLNNIADQCYGQEWPVKNMIKPKTKDDLNKIIPKSINKFQLFISDDILLYTLFVLNNSKTIQTEPIYRLAEQNQITKDISIIKGIREKTGQITLQPIDSEQIMKPFVLDKNIISHFETINRKNIATLKPTLSDIDSATVWMINRDLRRGLPDLTENVKSWIKTLYTYYPGSNTMKNFLFNLNEFVKNYTTLSPTEYQTYINSTSIIKLPQLKFDHCNGSDSSKRGYPCTLWVLFHSMTVKQAILAEQNALPSDIKPSDVIVSIREFIGNFFLCEECVTHFVNMTINAENEIKSHHESILYLWRSHNIVNKRLRYEEYTNDPNWPKVPFPTKEQCNLCAQQIDENGDAREYNENETYKFLKEFYSLNNSMRIQTYNLILLFSIVILNILISNK
ncbi:unnamed protein product [Adineta steineri]|uniref:Sulfhydryl oxidase n=1 Tax=Adineta steineri TaxID=433720 RepID=A0A814VLD7_9BILA|nr:unnamed protein product [Adineta steineri]CAF3999996.1 unnamed protein product [Adineta steineri]